MALWQNQFVNGFTKLVLKDIIAGRFFHEKNSEEISAMFL